MADQNTPEQNLSPAGSGVSGGSASRYADPGLIKSRFADAVTEVAESRGEITVTLTEAGLLPVLRFLRDEPQFAFDFLSDLSGADLGEFAEPRFIVAYHLFSTRHNHRLRVKLLLNEDNARVPSVSGIWKSANWMEREVFDMYGIDFAGHPDLRRILMPADYEGFPLRKDFPTKGY